MLNRLFQSVPLLGVIIISLSGCYGYHPYSEETVRKAEQSEQRISSEQTIGIVSQALNEGKSVILTQAPAHTGWVSLGPVNKKSVSLKNNGMYIDGYAVSIIEPGVYSLSQALLTADKTLGPDIPIMVQDSTVKDPLGSVLTVQATQQQSAVVINRYYDSWNDGFSPYYSGFIGRGYPYHRRHYRSFTGLGIGYSPYYNSYPRSYVSRTYVPGKTEVWTVVQKLSLPNNGMREVTAKNKKSSPYIATLTARPGELLITDSLGIASVATGPNCQEVDGNPDEKICPAEKVVVSLLPVTKNETNQKLPVVAGRTATVRPLEKGVWLSESIATYENGRAYYSLEQIKK